MKAICRGRREGKSTDLLALCIAADGIIACANQRMVEELPKGVKAITHSQLLDRGFMAGRHEKVFIDDVDLLLRRVLHGGMLVDTVTFSMEDS